MNDLENLQRQINDLRRQLELSHRYEVLTTAYDDLLPTPVAAFPGSAAPSVTAYLGGNMVAYEFPNNATKNYHCNWQFPHSWKEETAIYPHLHLFIPDTTTGVIKFSAIVTWVIVDAAETVGGEFSISGTFDKSSGAATNGNAILKLDSTPIPATSMTLSSILQMKLWRDPTDVTDTFGASVWLKSIDLHCKRDSLGSRTEYTK